MPGRVIVQWDEERDCADLGLIKIDLLGLGMMAVLRDSITLIKDHYQEEVDLAKLPPDDKDVYDALQKADTVGLFQVESRAQMASLPRHEGAENFYDIVVQVAIIRPGPIVGKMMHPYLRRREGEEEADLFAPMPLEPVPAEAHFLGVPLFQEQLSENGDDRRRILPGVKRKRLRRAMGFKRSEQRMIDIEARLRSGMENKGITGETQNTIVKSITAFALYGFPESHAASFALLAYASAYLKCHYLAAFTAALLNNQPMGFYGPQTLVKDAQRHGLHFLPVDVMRSDWVCTIEECNGQFIVRLGFNYVKGFTKQTGVAIVERRPFKDIDDLQYRVPEISKDEMTALADLGALNELGGKRHRRDALWQSALALRPVGELLMDAGIAEIPSPLVAMTPIERLQADFANSGLSIGSHPMRFHRERLNAMQVIPAGRVKSMPDGRFIGSPEPSFAASSQVQPRDLYFLVSKTRRGIANVILKPDVFESLAGAGAQ